MSRRISSFAAAAACVLLLALTPAPYAQNQAPQGGPRFQPNPDRMTERLTRELNLNADQQKKIKAIYAKAFQGAAPAGNGATGAAARRQRMQQQNNAQNDFRKRFEQMNAEIKKVLTPEQQKKFDAMPRFGNGRGMGMNTDDRIARMDQRLKLSADQKTKLKTVMEKQNQEMQKMFQQRTQQGGQQNGNREAMQAEMQKIRDKNQKEIEAVLTPAQQKQYRAMQEEQRQQRQQRQQQGGGFNQR